MEENTYEQVLKVTVHLESRLPDKTVSLPVALSVLQVYNQGIQKSLELSAKRFSADSAGYFLPSARIEGTRTGSVEIDTLVVVAAGIANQAYPVVKYAWDLFFDSFDFVEKASFFFRREQAPMSVTLTNSPGATVNLVAGNATISQDVSETSKAIGKALAKADLPKQFGQTALQMVSFRPQADDSIQGEINITHENVHDFLVPEADFSLEDIRTFTGSIFQVSTKSLKGKCEIFETEDAEPENFHFTIEQAALDAAIDALKKPLSKISAQATYRHNALGEKRILRLHIISVEDAPQQQDSESAS